MSEDPKKPKQKPSKKTATKRKSKAISKQKKPCDVSKPKWEQEEIIGMVERMAKTGQPIALIAQILGIDQATFWRWRQEGKELNARFQRARGEGLGKVVDTAYKMATSGKNEGMTKWYMEKMGSQIVQNIHDEATSDERKDSDENIKRQRVVEALRKDKFLDIKPDEINQTQPDTAPPQDEAASGEVIDVTPAPVKDPMS